MDFPIQDAESFYQMLVNHYSFKSESITFLKNPTRTELIISLDELGQKVSPSDNLLIFYAGHRNTGQDTQHDWNAGDEQKSHSANVKGVLSHLLAAGGKAPL